MLNKVDVLNKKTFEDELENILSWWANNIIDASNDDFIGRIDGYGKKYPDAPKGVVFMTRILWAFSAAARLGFDRHVNVAHKAYKYIREYFVDKENGGLFWMLDAEGNPLDTKKQTYAQAFGIYAMAEYYMLTHDQNALELARELFQLIRENTLDINYGGYTEAMTVDWQAMEDVRLSEKEADDRKTMNTHLHILECFTNLFRCDKSELVAEALQDLILLYSERFIDERSGRLKLFFNDYWDENVTHHSYGHEIESAWLLNEAAMVLKDDDIIKDTKELTELLALRVLKEGLDVKGAVYNEMSLAGEYDKFRDWWPQAEGVIGFYDAYKNTGYKSFERASESCWKYINEFVIEHETGAWHWAADENGNPVLSEDKAGPWIAPYHSSRMCIEMIQRIN